LLSQKWADFLSFSGKFKVQDQNQFHNLDDDIVGWLKRTALKSDDKIGPNEEKQLAI